MAQVSEEQAAKLKKDVYAALENLQSALRAYRVGTQSPPAFLREKQAPEMRDDAFGDCRVFANRHKMIHAMGKGAIGAEVGVQHGNFSRFILNNLDVTELHLFDRQKDIIREDVRQSPQVSLHIGDSSSELDKLPDAYFDWIYVDGDHSYSGALKDARVAVKKVKPGGTLFFNDYTPWSIGEAIPYGVMAVVNELVNDGLDMTGVALTANGYFDVALRR